MNLKSWLGIVKKVAPAVLLLTPLAPIAPFIILGIEIAEKIPGASGPEKLEIAKAIARVGINAANAKADSPVIDPEAVDQLVTSSINAIVAATNLKVKVQ